MRIRIIVLLFALSIGITTTSQAAFVVKETKTEQTTNNQIPAALSDDENAAPAVSATAEPAAKATAAPTFGKARISKFAYILLSIFLLGFVAIGLNDYWRGSSWIVCMVLSLLYLPGLIYALVSMPRYYHNKNKTFRY